MNQIYTSDLLSFQKRLAPTVDSDVVIDRPKTEILPEPYVITHERKIRFKLYYPNARKVEMWDYLKEYKLEKNISIIISVCFSILGDRNAECFSFF